MQCKASRFDFGIFFIVHHLLITYTRLWCVGAEKAYPAGCSQKEPSYYDYDNSVFPPLSLPVKSVDDYLLTRRLGTGKFSDVFEAVDCSLEQIFTAGQNPTSSLEVDPRTLVVLKCLKPVSDRKIRRELLVLQRVTGLPNLTRLVAMVVTPQYYLHNRMRTTDLPRMPALILQHAGPSSQWLCHDYDTTTGPPQPNVCLGKETEESPRLSDTGFHTPSSTSSSLTDYEIRYYLYHLLKALDGLHAAGIMHRDVKPRNVLINRSHHNLYGPLTLIDLGLAEFYHPDIPYNVRVASRHYKAPELLVGFGYYDYAVDMWGVGCILAGLLWRREPFFRGRDNVDQLMVIVDVLGIDDFFLYIEKYQVKLVHEVQTRVNELLETVLQSSNETAVPNDEHRCHDGYTCHVGCRRERMSWPAYLEEMLSSKGRIETTLPPLDGLDLLDHLLVYDHTERWTAQQAMKHPFFDAVRDRVETEIFSGLISK